MENNNSQLIQLIINYLIPPFSVLIALFYFIRVLRDDYKEKQNKIGCNEDTQSSNGTLSLPIGHYNQEIFYINYDEGRDADNRDTEININMLPYFNALIDHIKNTKECLYVIDRPGYNKPLDEDIPFFDTLKNNQLRYFQSVELLVKKQILYVRVLQLPLGIDDANMSNKVKAELAIEKLGDLAKEHIRSMLEFENFELYVLTKPIIAYSQAIIDGTKQLVELDRYDLESRPLPNRLTINIAITDSSDRESRMIIQEYQYIKYVLNGHNQISKQEIAEAILTIENKVMASKNDIKKPIDNQ